MSSASPCPKYIFVNGIMKLNPVYDQPGAGPKASAPSTVSDPSRSLAVLSTMGDVMAATSASPLGADGQPSLRMSESTTCSLEIMQDGDFLSKFGKGATIDGGELLDKISQVFAKYEVPIGLVNKLLALSQYSLHFIIDDSGSMGSDSDQPIAHATKFLRDRQTGNKRVTSPQYQEKMSRWEEAEDRMHILISILALIPTGPVTISCLNNSTVLRLQHQGQGPDVFESDAHNKITNLFSMVPRGGTPIYTRLDSVLNSVSSPTMVLLFTDGVPSDRSVHDVQNLVINRPRPQMSPITFITCTDEDQDSEWMKGVEEQAPYCTQWMSDE